MRVRIKNCWAPGISDRLIVTNLLVCRIKRDIESVSSRKTSARDARPKLMQYTLQILQRSSSPNLRARTFSGISNPRRSRGNDDYVMTEIGYPLRICSHTKWAIRRWAMNYVTRLRASRLSLFNDEQHDVFEEALTYPSG